MVVSDINLYDDVKFIFSNDLVALTEFLILLRFYFEQELPTFPAPMRSHGVK